MLLFLLAGSEAVSLRLTASPFLKVLHFAW